MADAGRDRFGAPPAGERRGDRIEYRDAFVAQEQGYRPLLLDLIVPADAGGPVPVVLWIHGGGWLNGSPKVTPDWLAGEDHVGRALAAGLAVALPAYRLSREAAFPAPLHDLKSAVRYLRFHAAELGIDPARVGVWGESAGGLLASLVALVTDPALEGTVGVTDGDSSVQAAVIWYGPSELATMRAHQHPRATGDHDADDSPESLLIGAPVTRSPERAAAASPVTYVRADAPPMLLLHGEEDVVVGYRQSVALADRLRAAGARVELGLVPGADHLFGGADLGAQVRRSVAFLRDALRA
ncbi:alpha/beta hydrolase [Catenuloplanes atrovinosus]|uniref:Acetyl esterase/lipase n=1 Tax=Catenuloplanes atrovinosus TaxID=137266 RepID=A0AAE3YNH7_9ACTN|nr:alpha/beta hydrolase [Catenuloplanes atrovinosus]MDR7275304.1 acetyl esterase/lipase [Catenuloplanes atrovinosus]